MGSSAPVQAPVVEEEADLESMDNHSSPAPEKANNTKNQRKLSPGMKALIIMMMKMPDQAVLAKHKCLFIVLCIVVELAGQGSAISRATPSSSINYPVPPSSISSMSVWSKKSISMKAGLFTMAFASKEAMVVLLPSPIKKMTKNKTANV